VIFVDSSFWVALRFARDARHGEARDLLSAHADSSLVTSNHVRGETWTFLRRRAGHDAATHFLDALAGTRRLQLVFVAEQLEQSALEWLRRHDEREYSYVDATSFALMRSLQIREALAFDGDFQAAGFVELRLV
jgi:predicted nucleic acid-binding protein